MQRCKERATGIPSPIDEINKKEKENAETSSGTGGGGVSPGQMFKEEAITNPIKGNCR